AHVHELLRQLQGSGGHYRVGVRLERQSEQANLFTLYCLQRRGKLVEDALTEALIHLAGGAQNFQWDVVLKGKLGERFHLGFYKWSAERRSRLEAARSNLLVESERERQIDGVRAHVLA